MSLFPTRLGWCPGALLVALLTAALFAQAQAQAQSQSQSQSQSQGASASASRPDPLDAQVRVPAVTHTSALSGYRRLGEDKRIDWKEANETVNRIGGWRAYAREAQQPDSAASAPAGGAAPASAAGAAPAHGGHKKH